jgi:hypothetical protein
MRHTHLTFFVLLYSSVAFADCQKVLTQVVESAIHAIQTSNLDPRCKALGLMGGKQNCVKAKQGTIWDLKALVEPIHKRAVSVCRQPQCSHNKNLCLNLLDNERYLLAVGIYGLLDDIENAPWKTLASSR